MHKRLALYVACLVGVGIMLAPSVRAEDDWEVKWSNGHKMESSDGKFELKFGGRIQADYIFANQDSDIDALLGEDAFTDGFEFRRARLFFEGTIYERISFKAQYDFVGGDADFKDVWIALDNSWGDLKFGHFKEPISLNELTSSKYLAFLERALPVEVFAPSRNSGVGASGSSEKISWGAGAFYDADDFGTSLNKDRKNVSGRLVFRPFYEDKGKKLFHIGIDASQKMIEDGGTLRFRGRPGNHFGPRPIDTGGIPADDALLLGVEVAGVANRFWYSGEYYNADVSTPSNVDPEEILKKDPSLDGWYVQGGFFLTDDYRRYKKSSGAWDRQKPSRPWVEGGGKGAWEIALRYAEVDLSEAVDPGKISNYTVGVNWYPNPATRLMVNFVGTDVKGTGVDGTINSFLVRWQVDF